MFVGSAEGREAPQVAEELVAHHEEQSLGSVSGLSGEKGSDEKADYSCSVFRRFQK
jgi:hypothetical protein